MPGKIVCIGDLHFGQPKLSAESLYMKLRACLYKQLIDADVLFITGDLFDQLLTINSKAYKFASMFIRDMLTIAKDTGMLLRILHGTFTHDRDQISVFSTWAESVSEFKVINEITAETIQMRDGDDLHVGYLPDNLPYKYSSDAISQLKTVMTVAGYGYLDVLIGHGTFEHVLPPGINKPSCLYTVSQFKDIVHGPLIFGHVHTPSVYKNMYYCGSFDRMSHGEEEDKGYRIFTVDRDHHWTSEFITNPYTVCFKSMTFKETDPVRIVHEFKSRIPEMFPSGKGYVRVIHPNAEIRSLLHQVCSDNFPDIVYSAKSSADVNPDTTESLKIDDGIKCDEVESIVPTAVNLGDLIYRYLEKKQFLGSTTRDEIVQEITDICSEAGHSD